MTMEHTSYMVRVLMNGRQSGNLSEFTSKDDAIFFANKVNAMADDDVTIEVHVYEATEIAY